MRPVTRTLVMPLCTRFFSFQSTFWTPQNPQGCKSSRLRAPPYRSYVRFMGQPQFRRGSSEYCPHASPPPSKPGMLACFGVWMVGSTTAASTATGRGSTVALLAGRHVSRLRHLWFSAMRSSHRGEEPFSSLLCLQTRGPGARLPLPHHPCTTYPVVSTSQCCKSGFLSKSPWCYPSSGVLYSHVSYGNGLLMGVSTCSLCPHL